MQVIWLIKYDGKDAWRGSRYCLEDETQANSITIAATLQGLTFLVSYALLTVTLKNCHLDTE